MRQKLRTVIFKTKNILGYSAIAAFFGILLYRVPALRAIGKNVCLYLIGWLVPSLTLDAVNRACLRLECVFRCVIVLFLLVSLLVFCIQVCWGWWLKRQRGDSRLAQSLLRYLRDTDVPRCFLVTGKWGAGKTYEVGAFFSKYYCFSRTKVYRISCFGLSSRQELVKEIADTIEKGDDSLYALLVKALPYLPVIGDAVGKLFKRSYGYTSAKKGSVFIFDDFERLTARSVTGPAQRALYRKNPFLLSRNNAREFGDIKREFASVERAIAETERHESQIAEQLDMDKYIAVIGLINELVETCGMKTVILCNSDILGERFLQDVLRSKLDCLEYKKSVSPAVIASVIDSFLARKTLEDDAVQSAVAGYLARVKEPVAALTSDSVFENLRFFSGLLEAFVSAAELFKASALTVDFLNSLFNSILVTHAAFYGGFVDRLGAFVPGAGIPFLCRLFLDTDAVPDLLRPAGITRAAGWVDLPVSGYWILNLSAPGSSAKVYADWEKYPFYALEEALCADPEALFSAPEYDFIHILFYYESVDRIEQKSRDCAPLIRKALEGYSLSDPEVADSLLCLCAQVFRNGLPAKLFTPLFALLKENLGGDPVPELTSVHRLYNEFLRGDLTR